MINRRQWMQAAGALIGGLTLQSHFHVPTPQLASPIILRNNENPYGPSTKVLRQVAGTLASMNRYHWDDSFKLIQALAEYHGLAEPQITIGAGSTELLDLLAAKTFLEKGNVVLGDPSYDYWLEPWIKQGLAIKRILLTQDKQLDTAAMFRAVDANTRLVYICNPNNPTGTLLSVAAIQDLLQLLPQKVVVAVDEAYIDYTNQPSMVQMINQFPNLVVLRTFSKIDGLAGARVGYAVMQEPLRQILDGHRSSSGGSVSLPSRWAALFALRDVDFREKSREENNKVKAWTVDALTHIGLPCIPSLANFLYFSLEGYSGDYFQQLEKHQIQGTRIYEERGKWTRITIGKKDEMAAFINALQL
jgi:histidinol-phosphate aminotransferase